MRGTMRRSPHLRDDPVKVAMPAAIDQDRTTVLVDVPGGLEGFVLVLRLHDHRAQNKQTSDGRWRVHVPLSDVAALPELLSAVEQWLRSERILATTVHLGDDVHRVTAATAPTPLRLPFKP